MIGCVCDVLLDTGETVTGRMELRGIYEPAYGFRVVGDGKERYVSWYNARTIAVVDAMQMTPLIQEQQDRVLAS
jgi:hypothetical protein